MEWIQSHPLSTVNLYNLSSWKRFGEKGSQSSQIYCDPEVYKELQSWRLFYNCKLSNHESSSARNRLNPYESIENGIFQNRAGMKLANIDADLNFALTSPRNPDGSPAVGPSDTLYFADICGGPGGFSEYMLYRKGIDAKGFGITLRHTELDYNMAEIQAGPAECLEVYHGQHNTGDILDPVNVNSFAELVLRSTKNEGAHVVVADGGVDVEHGKDFDRENACKSLYLAQILLALKVLRNDGIMVCKVFETQTVFSVGLLYLVHLCFEKICVYKPRMSRPQNSERYLVCFFKRHDIESIVKYFAECHKLLWEWTTNVEQQLQQLDIVEVVSLEALKKSPAKDFVDKLLDLNTRLAYDQLQNLKDLKRYAENPHLQAPDKDAIRARCFEEWRIPAPEERRLRLKRGVRPYREMTEETYDRLCHRLGADIRSLPEVKVTYETFKEMFKSPYDWRVAVVQSNRASLRSSRGLYMSQGGSEFFRYNASTNEWVEVSFSIELPKDTILFGECVTEFCGTGAAQKKIRAFHIIDVLFVNGKNVGGLHFMNRYEILQKLARSVNKPSRADLIEVRAKQLIRFENLGDFFRTCKKQEAQGEDGIHWTCHTDITDSRSSVILADGLLFLKMTKDPWMMSVSRSSLRKYWYHAEAETSSYDLPPSAIQSFVDTMKYRGVWQWDESTQLHVNKGKAKPLNNISNGVNSSAGELDAEEFMTLLSNFMQSLGEHSTSPTKKVM